MSSKVALGEVATIIMGQSPDSHLCNDEGKGIAFLQGCAEFDLSIDYRKLLKRKINRNYS